MRIQDFNTMKQNGEKITVITCYDYTFAKIIDQSDIPVVLVGDSAAMVMHGYDSTIPATTNMMAVHVAAVAKGASNKFIVGDMPFLSYRVGKTVSVSAIQQLMQAGAHAVKLEGAEGNCRLIEHVVASGVPVMGHLGLTPQSVHQLGGFRVQGREEVQAALLLKQAKQLEEAGCFSVVLECVPSALAATITKALSIPTIGIGAGADVDGQVLVLQDMLGMNQGFSPKFLKRYLSGFDLIQSALNEFSREVKSGIFPSKEHGYE